MTQPAVHSGQASPRHLPARGWLVDFALVTLLVATTGVWGTHFWNTWTTRGGNPEFYQLYFEPAVMVACGKGFVISDHQPKALEDFLWRRRDSLTCADLPPDLALGDRSIYQGAWTYLQYAVGWSWRVLGISWSGMGPLFGLLFGLVCGIAYAIFRLGMGRVIALACVVGIATSSIHLLNLPHLRDYSKAPFTLALVLLLGHLVTHAPRRRTVLLLAAAYGAVLGLGYGFRTDLLINLPVIAIALFGFLPGGMNKNLVLKGVATLLAFATFAAVSWPITSAVSQKGGCQWHVALLGMQSTFDSSLRITPAPYEFGHAYADQYVVRGVQGFAHRTEPGSPPPPYCSSEYDVHSGRLLAAIVTSFPGDFVTRAYASVFQVIELPYIKPGSPMQGWAAPLYEARQRILARRLPWGILIAGIAVLLATFGNQRLGLFLMFILAYSGGYPAIQFQERHFFHLEFLGWWALGFVVQQSVWATTAFRRGEMRPNPAAIRLVTLAAKLAVIAVVVFGGLLASTRWYQGRQARQLFASYLAAPTAPLEDPLGPLSGVTLQEWPQFIEVRLDEAACGPRPAVTFRYDRSDPNGDFTSTVTIERRTSGRGATRVLQPVFEQYAGVSVSDARPGCLIGVSRFTDLRSIPLMLGVVLPPDWETLPLYQRMAQWEQSPEPLVSAPRLKHTEIPEPTMAAVALP